MGHKSWTHLLAALDGNREAPEKAIEKLNATQVKKGQIVQIAYEPGKQVEIERVGPAFKVLTTNDKKIQLNDIVDFRLIELHYPLTFTSVTREGKSIGRVQVATVSGITAIKKS